MVSRARPRRAGGGRRRLGVREAIGGTLGAADAGAARTPDRLSGGQAPACGDHSGGPAIAGGLAGRLPIGARGATGSPLVVIGEVSPRVLGPVGAACVNCAFAEGKV